MDIKNQYEFFKNVKLTEDGYLIVSGAGGGTTEEVDITINGDVYKSIEAPGTEDIIVKDQDDNQVGELIGGEWIVPTGKPEATYSTNPDFLFTIKPTGTFSRIKVNSGVYNFDIYVDGVLRTTGATGNTNITGLQTGKLYDIKITGTFDIGFNGMVDVIFVEDWSSTKWKTLYQMFQGNQNPFTFTDKHVPDLSECDRTNNMFYLNNNFTFDISNWDTSNIKFFQSMFHNVFNYTMNINNLDLSSAANINSMINNNLVYKHDVDLTDPIKGANNVINIDGFGGGCPIKSFKINCTNVNHTLNNTTFFHNPSVCEELLLYDLKQSFEIWRIPTLTGIAIDNLANSVGTVTGKTIKMTAGQRSSCDQSLWTNKGWTITV